MEDGDTVYGCPECGHHWDAADEGDGEGLECPECGSDSVHDVGPDNAG